MDQVPYPAGTVRFGVFEADLAAGELRKNGRKVRIQYQPFQVLAILLERPGEVVTREELREKLWPADTYVDFDRSLNTAVAKLRGALGDSGDSPRFIETLPRKGYRFVADAGPVPTPPLPPAPPSPIRVPWAMVAVAGVAVAAVLVALAVWLSRAPGGTPLVAVPLTSYPGVEFGPTFSPDGNDVAFSWNGWNEDNFDIYRKVIGSEGEEPFRVTRDPAPDYAPSWSPDGKLIALLRCVGQHEQEQVIEEADIILVSPLGVGVERRLVRVRLQTWMFRCSPPAWSPSGRWIVAPDQLDPNGPAGLFAISVETREKRRLTTGLDHFPAYAPDGRSLVFSRGDGIMGDLFSLEVSDESVAVSEPRQLTFDRRRPFHPAWLPGGRDVVFAAGAVTAMGLYRFPASGKSSPAALPVYSEDGLQPAVSRAAARLAYVLRSRNQEIMRAPAPGTGNDHVPPCRFAPSSRREANPRYSPDGRRVAFSSGRSGSHELWVCDSDGSNAVHLTKFGKMHVGSPRWSPDGKEIVFNSSVSGHRDVFRIPADGGKPERVTDRASMDGDAGWSRDGRWIYFTSDRSGEFQLWKVAAEGGEPVQVTQGGGRGGFESMDGACFYYAKPADPWSVWRVPSDGGEEAEVIPAVWGQHCFRVRPEGIYFIDGDGEWVKRWDYRTGEAVAIRKIEEPGQYGFDISPDGRWLLYTHAEEASDLMLVENFR